MIEKIPHFRFWCQKVLPLVYDDSLSYYEVLCKVVTYINKLITDNNQIINELDALQEELKIVQNWIDNFDTTIIEELIKENLMHMIIVSITDDGYFLITIPDGWEDITFNTTGYDITLPIQPEFGHLVLSY